MDSVHSVATVDITKRLPEAKAQPGWGEGGVGPGRQRHRHPRCRQWARGSPWLWRLEPYQTSCESVCFGSQGARIFLLPWLQAAQTQLE